MDSYASYSRRHFLAQTATGASLLLAPTVFGKDKVAPSDRITMGFIGVGGMGQNHLRSLKEEPDVQIVALCDVDRNHLNAAYEALGDSKCKTYADFRELLARDDIDAVLIATPDHWHGLIAVAAANAGKHIYCEKPLTNSVAEGRAVCEAVRANEVVLQTGSHERSNPGPSIARKLINEGRIGQVQTVRIFLPTDEPHLRAVADLKTAPDPMPVPEGLDYDFWLGHTPVVPYTEKRCHFFWRFHSAYGGGEMTDRGAHVIDLAKMILGRDDTGPVAFRATGKPLQCDFFDAILDFEFENTYADGLRMLGSTTGKRGVKFEGSEGSIFVEVHGGALSAEPASILADVTVPAAHHYEPHRREFLEAVKHGTPVVAPAEAGHRTATICHLNNIAMRLGKEFTWDPATEQSNNADVNEMLKPSMREPWKL